MPLASIVAYWAMEGSSGETDGKGSNNLSAGSGTPGSTTGIVNNARDFVSASSQYLFASSNSDLQTGDIDFTVQVWFKLSDKSSHKGIISKYSAGELEYMLFYDQFYDQFIWRVSANGSSEFDQHAYTLGSPSTGVWYHILAWHDSVNNEIGIRINNGSPDTASYSGGVYAGSGVFYIGLIYNAFYCDAAIDEVAFFKGVLNSTEQNQLWNGGAALPPPWTQNLTRTMADAPSTSATLVASKNLNRSTTGAPSVSGTLTRTLASTRSTTGAPLTSDALTRTLGAARTMSAAPSTSDTMSLSKSYTRTMTGAPSTSDALTRGLQATRTLADAPSTTETWARSLGISRTMTGAPSTSDQFAAPKTIARVLTDAPGTADAFARFYVASRTMADAPSTFDTMHFVLPAVNEPIRLFYTVPGPVAMKYSVPAAIDLAYSVPQAIGLTYDMNGDL